MRVLARHVALQLSGDSQRSATRVRVAVRPELLEVWTHGYGWQRIDGHVVDVSQTGVRVRTHFPLSPGATVRIAVPGVHHTSTRVGHDGQVVHVQPASVEGAVAAGEEREAGIVYRPEPPGDAARLATHVLCLVAMALVWHGVQTTATGMADALAGVLVTGLLLFLMVGAETQYRQRLEWFNAQAAAWHERLGTAPADSLYRAAEAVAPVGAVEPSAESFVAA